MIQLTNFSRLEDLNRHLSLGFCTLCYILLIPLCSRKMNLMYFHSVSIEYNTVSVTLLKLLHSFDDGGIRTAYHMHSMGVTLTYSIV